MVQRICIALNSLLELRSRPDLPAERLRVSGLQTLELVRLVSTVTYERAKGLGPQEQSLLVDTLFRVGAAGGSLTPGQQQRLPLFLDEGLVLSLQALSSLSLVRPLLAKLRPVPGKRSSPGGGARVLNETEADCLPSCPMSAPRWRNLPSGPAARAWLPAGSAGAHMREPVAARGGPQRLPLLCHPPQVMAPEGSPPHPTWA